VSEALVYLDGVLCPESRAALPLSDAGVVLGATVSEMARTFHRRPYRLEDHLDRLFESLNAARLKIALSRSDLNGIVNDLVHRNAALLGPADELGIVVFVTAGVVATYARMAATQRMPGPTVCAHTFPLPFALWAKPMREGVRLVIPSVRQVPDLCINPHIKCRSRMHYFLADQEAKAEDPEARALLLDLEGNVTEAATANFLLVEEGAMASPRSEKILPGVSRAVVRELASLLSIRFHERDLSVADVFAGDEALLTSTPYCLLPVTRVNGQLIGNGKPGPVFERLCHAWSAAVGLDIAAQIADRSP
jgi:branched-subunit amino acid aminotransferase/4-amino-4-deoxychorismate lyase